MLPWCLEGEEETTRIASVWSEPLVSTQFVICSEN